MAEDRGQNRKEQNVKTREDAYKWIAAETVEKAFDDYVRWLRKPDYEEELDAISSESDTFNGLYKAVKDYEAYSKEAHPGEEEVKDFISRVKAEYREALDVLKENTPFTVLPSQLEGSYPYATWNRIKKARTLTGLVRTASIAKRSYVMYLNKAIRANNNRKDFGKQIEDFVMSDQFTLYTGGKFDPELFFAEAKRRAEQKDETFG